MPIKTAEKELSEKIGNLVISITSVNAKLDNIVRQQQYNGNKIEEMQKCVAKMEGDIAVLAEKNKRIYENKERLDGLEKKVEIIDNNLSSTMYNVKYNVKNWEKVVDWAAKVLIGIGMLYFAYKLDVKADADVGLKQGQNYEQQQIRIS